MPDRLAALNDLSVQIFAIASMASIGLRYAVVVMTVVVSLVTMAVLFPAARLLNCRTHGRSAAV